jgi:hypothetical protein
MSGRKRPPQIGQSPAVQLAFVPSATTQRLILYTLCIIAGGNSHPSHRDDVVWSQGIARES